MTLNAPTVSIVIPAFQAEAYLSDTLESVRLQDIGDIEILVVNDGSTDGTEDVVRRAAARDPRITLLQGRKRGPGCARAVGTAASRGRYVYFLDADDTVCNSGLRRLMEPLEYDKKLVAAFGRLARMDARGRRFSVGPILPQPIDGDALPLLLAGRLPFGNLGTVLTRGEHARRARIDVSLTLGEDLVMLCDIAAMGPMTYVGGEPVMDYRIHSSSSVHRHFLDWQPSLDMIFEAPEVRARFDASWTKHAREKHEAAVRWGFVAVMFLRSGRYDEARRVLVESLRQDWRTRPAWVLLACATAKHVPPWIARRVGIAVSR